MQSNQEFTIEQLPKRPAPTSASEKFKKELVTTNYYKIVKLASNIICQYDITFDPELPVDSRAIFKGCIQSVAAQLKDKLKFYIHRGKIIWAFANLEGLQSFKCKYIHKKGNKDEEKTYDNVLTLNKTREIDLRALHGGTKTAQQVLQVLNSNLKKVMEASGLQELGRSGKFYNKQDVEIVEGSPFKVFRGFTTSIHLINNQLNLLLDVSTRIIRKETLYETMNNLRKDQVQELIGRSVLATYGTWRIYKIVKISTDKKVTDTFLKNGQPITYIDYFKNAYGVTIKNKDQRLILSEVKDKVINAEGEMVQKVTDIYLVPEMVNLTGMSEYEKNDFKVMSPVAKYTKLTAQYRVMEGRQLLKRLKHTEFYSVDQVELKVNGYILDQPTIVFGDNVKNRPNNGIIFQKGRIYKPMHLKDWVLAYTETSDRDRDICDDFVATLKKSSVAYGIKIQEPQYLVIKNGKEAEFVDKIEGYVAKNGKPPIILTLLKPAEKRYYGNLKHLLLNQLGIPHQVVITKTVDNDKRKMSVCSKILIQMNAKIGNAPWKVERKLASLKDKKIIMGGMAIYHKLVNKNKSCCAFVGSVDNDMTEYYMGAKLVPANQQKFDSLYQMVEEWVKTYCKDTKSTPDTLIIYRDGVGESQIKSVLDAQVEVIKKCIETIKIKMKKPDYNPGILFVLANKKINQRLYESSKGQSQGRGKGTQKIENPQSGTVVGKGISRYGFDFHMSPHSVTEGTCTPTQFNVIYNTTTLSEEEIMTLTFESCFNYFNWAGAVRVPAALQYANKLATLVGDAMKSEPSDIELKKKIYCL